MKQFFTMAMGVVIISLSACNNGSQTAGQQSRSDTSVTPEILTGDKPYDYRFVGAFEKARQTVNKYLHTGKFNDSVFWSFPLHQNYAREYIQAFPQGFAAHANARTSTSAGPIQVTPQSAALASLALNKEQMATFFDFNDTTLQAFVDLYKAKKIDGIRVYMAKYTNDSSDVRNIGLTRYTVILVGTKDSSGIPVDQFIRSKRDPELMISIQDYTNPCTPSPCPPPSKGALLLQNP